MRRPLIGGLLAAAVVVAGTGVAVAVSDGGYSYERQHCSAHADRADEPTHTEPGCHSATGVIYDGNGHEYVNVGTQQQPDGSPTPTDGGDYSVDPGGGAPAQAGTFGNGQQSTTFVNPTADPSKGFNFYFGADDNLDNGEHDNSPLGSGGPSDGGSINVNVNPATVALWLAAITSGDLTYLFQNPVPLANAQIGAGADGHDFSVTTNRRVIYQGGGSGNPPNRDAGDYSSAHWDPPTCAGPSDTKADCGGHDLGWWDAHNGTVYAEPGVQVYEDPDPQGSPEPDQTWPNPAVAVTTCGVYLGGGSVAAPAGTPGTNSAGQFAAPNPACQPATASKR